MTQVEPLAAPIGAATPRARARRLLHGKGSYTDDIVLPRIVHLAFLRSPHAHAEIVSIEAGLAKDAPGVVAVFTAADLSAVCRAWTAQHAALPALKSQAQTPLADGRATWQGEAILAIAAESRAQAEDALDMVEVNWRELHAVADSEGALQPAAPRVHPLAGDNLALELRSDAGDSESAFGRAAVVVEDVFRFARQTGVCLEPRSIVASWDPGDQRLTVHHSHQTPHNMQDIFALLLNLPEHKVRVICPDVGGAFGVKQQLYPDEIATCAVSILLERPVKFVADRIESFASDIHARDHVVAARLAVDADGRMRALEIDDLFGIGAYSNYPRTSVGEGLMAISMAGAPYRFDAFRGRLRIVNQHKPPIGHYRGVGHPIAVTVTEALVEQAARALAVDPVELRRRNLVDDCREPFSKASGLVLHDVKIARCFDALEGLLDLGALRIEQARLREAGRYRGIGLAAFIELTAPGPEYYGRAEARITAADGCVVRLEPSGVVRCLSSVTDQGQGAEEVIRQIVAGAVGVSLEDVDVITGDSATTPYGAGAWASRSAAIGGEAALRAGRTLRANLLDLAGAMLQARPEDLSIAEGWIIDARDGHRRLTLVELARVAHFRQDSLPAGLQPQILASSTYVPREHSALIASGVQVSHLEVDVATGLVTLLGHWVVHECGRLINPLLVEEQIRGGVVQGIGSALYEECVYDAKGQLLNASLMDYLVPMAAEMPDIVVRHVEGRPSGSTLAAKGAGEAGVAGAQAAVLNAINDAIAPFGARVSIQPSTPQRILEALGTV